MKKTNQILPYEKFLKFGPESLSDDELLAIVIRTGTVNHNAQDLARQVLTMANCGKQGLLGLHQISLEELSTIHGIGPVKAVKIKCITELSRRIASTLAWQNIVFQKSGTVANYLMESMRHLSTEQVVLLLLDTKGHLLKQSILSSGTANMSLLSPRELFKEALKSGAVQFIVAHNHPGGDPSPSKEDLKVTDTLFDLGKQLELPLIDHIIIGDHRYFSFKEQGLL